MANFSDDPYDLLDDEEEVDDSDQPEEPDDPAADLDNPAPSSQGESNPFGGSAPTSGTGENPEDAIEDITGDEPIPGKPFSIVEEVEKDEKAKYDIPPDGADVPEKKASELDELDEPTAEELEEIELEEEFGGKD